MKREAFALMAALFLMVFMISGVSASKVKYGNYQAITIQSFIGDGLKIVYNPMNGNDNGNNELSFILTDSDSNPDINFNLTMFAWDLDFYQHLIVGAPREKNMIITIESGGAMGSGANTIVLDGETYKGFINGYESYSGSWIFQNYKNSVEGRQLMYNLNFVSDKGKKITGFLHANLYYDINESKFIYSISYYSLKIFVEDTDNRLTLLESWKQTISDTITSILNSLTSYNTRITKLENSTSNGTTIINNTTIIISNGTNPYLKYLSSSDRKNMVCGFAEDNHLTNVIDLGWNCTITYRQTSRRETSSCRCRKL